MKKQILIAVAALVAAPAFAAPAEPFDGPFVGIQGGWQQDTQHLRIDDVDSTDRFRERKDGFAYGGQIGYDYRIQPRVVLGFEASVTGRTGHDDFSDSAGNDYRLKQGRTVGASARVGYLVTPTGLLYARGGYTNARFDLNDTLGDRASSNRDGYVAGVGYEQALTKTVSARVEYDYSNFGHDRLYDVGSDTDATARYRRNAVTAGLNLHF
ncbi:outer membrane beta-barrel protein [Sphingosinicellaceae bacterium]|nr:outer membrane beta-barrel protein [Sphingosinicellaceae bacterium]